MTYIAHHDRLTIEQRLWLAFLYSTCYCRPTAYHMLQEFPDYSETTPKKIKDWWDANKQHLVFESDRVRVKSYNLWPKLYESYHNLMGKNQTDFYMKYIRPTATETYDTLYKALDKLYYYGRFSIFLLTDVISLTTDYPIRPTTLPFRESVSSTNGLCYVIGKDEWASDDGALNQKQYDYLNVMLEKLRTHLKLNYPHIDNSYWDMSFNLCSYKRMLRNRDRYLGYYIDRHMKEILAMERRTKTDYSVFWNCRKRYNPPYMLGEYGGWTGPRPELCRIVEVTGKLTPFTLPDPEELPHKTLDLKAKLKKEFT